MGLTDGYNEAAEMLRQAQHDCAEARSKFQLISPEISIIMRFNFFSRNSAPTVNHEGAAAFTLTPEVELYAAVATATLGDQFYETADTRLVRLRELVAKNNPVFVAQLAV